MTKENIKSPFSILFVDDEENARKYFDKGLKNYFTILTAASVAEAQEVLSEKHNEIAVVVTDQRMPGGNGVKLLKFLRENHPHIVRLLTTAYSDLSEAIEAVNSGEIFRYIQKPWDYGLLKTEMHQAMELFELRLERNQMLHEKIMVKRRMTKMDRVRDVLLFAKSQNFLNFADISAQRFIKQFATNIQDVDDQDWESFDFGNQDVSEAKFFVDVIDKVQEIVPNSNDYSMNQIVLSDELKSIIEEQVNALGMQNNLEIDSNIQNSVNVPAFTNMIKALLKVSKDQESSSLLKVNKIDEGILVSLKIEKFNLAESSNLFITCPKNNAEGFYVNLLACYFLLGHLGGAIEISREDESLECSIKLPNDTKQSNFISQIEKDSSMENAILTVMMC